MLSFKSFLVEAKFSEEDTNRILNVFERRMPKLLGAKMYRYGGPNHVERNGSERRVVYIYSDHAFGVRYNTTRIHGIDVWTKFALNTNPDYFIDVSQLDSHSILASVTKLAQLIKKPVVGQTAAATEIKEGQLNEMATRVDAASFYQLVVDMYGEEKAKNLSWDEVRAVADQHDVLIPGYMKSATQIVSDKRGDKRFTAVPPSDELVAAKKAADAPILYIKVTAQDPHTKKFIAASESEAAQQLYAQLQGAVTDHKPTQAELRDPETLYGHLAQLVEMACKGHLRSLLIYGGPGTGKTHTIMQVIEKMGLVKGKDYQKLSGKASPIKIYETLFMYRDNGLVVFDDLDSMWGNEDATNILKAALDTSPVREISWVSNQTVNVSKMSDERKAELFANIDKQLAGETVVLDDGESDEDDDEDDGKKKKKGKAAVLTPDKIKYPSTFDFTGKVVFISNLKKEDFDTAIMSRSAKIDMTMTASEILQRMRNILDTLGGSDVSREKKEELLDHLLDMHKRRQLDAVTMREFIKGLNILRSGAPNYKDLLVYM